MQMKMSHNVYFSIMSYFVNTISSCFFFIRTCINLKNSFCFLFLITSTYLILFKIHSYISGGSRSLMRGGGEEVVCDFKYGKVLSL